MEINYMVLCPNNATVHKNDRN